MSHADRAKALHLLAIRLLNGLADEMPDCFLMSDDGFDARVPVPLADSFRSHSTLVV